jgi:membrane protease YdiL (CAAX protease family)
MRRRISILKRLDRKWIRIAIYYAIALGLSFLTRVYLGTSELADARLGAWGIFLHLLSGTGPFIGALAIWAAFRPERRMSFGGSFPIMGLAMLAVPAIALAGTGVANGFGLDAHLFGAEIGLWIALYAILEETGWRGYLQDELHDWPALLRYAAVGVLWYFWHFSYLLGDNPIGTEITNLGFLVLASIGIGFVADRTRSIFAAAAFHIVGNVLMTSTEFRTFIPAANARLTIVGICVIVWLIMLRLWAMRDKRIRATAEE